MVWWWLLLAVGCKSCENVTRCSEVPSLAELVGLDATTCTTREPAVEVELAFACQLPMEVLVGVSMSLTGNLSRGHETLLEKLRKWSSEVSANPISVTRQSSGQSQSLFPVKTCLRFCVLDDESSEQRMVELYRSFAGDGNSTPRAQLLLAPATHSFRDAATQVAHEYQKPMVLWTVPQLWNRFTIATEAKEEQELSQGADLNALASQSSFDRALGRYDWLYQSRSGCGSFQAPQGYEMRTGAEYLSCDGPCDALLHLDLCCRKVSALAVLGDWTPSSALPYGGWQNDCLRGEGLANETTNVSLTLRLPRSPAHVTIKLNWTSDATAPNLVVAEQSFSSRGAFSDVLVDGTHLSFLYSADADVIWEICLRQSCESFSCPSGQKTRPATFCAGAVCAPADVGVCCTASAEPWTSNSALDLVLPATYWAQDVLHQLSSLSHMLCIAEVGEHVASGFFVKLCDSYAEMAMALGLRVEVLRANYGESVGNLVVRLRPKPSFLLVCSDLDFYVSFTRATMQLHPDHGAVVSCLPFGDLLDDARGFEMSFRSLEPQPFPSYGTLQRRHHIRAREDPDLASLRKPFSEIYAEELGFNRSFSAELLFFYGAYQVLDQSAVSLAAALLQAQPKRRDLLLELSSSTFQTSLGPVRQGRRIERLDVATRQFVPLGLNAELSTPANRSWALRMLRFQRSEIRVADSYTGILPIQSEAKVKEMYPCPEGCEVFQSSCRACSPGKYRSAQLTCLPCISGTYQNNYAGAKCFECPAGARCNASEAPVAELGYFAFLDQTTERSFSKWNGPDACSIEPGGGLFNLHPNEVNRWSASKEEPLWYLWRCLPSLCLGENLCAASRSGPGCLKCQSGFSSLLRHGPCAKCPDVYELLTQSYLYVAGAQLGASTALALASLLDLEDIESLVAPMLLASLQGLQSLWVLKAVNPFDEESYTLLGSFAEFFMMPFLLPVADCYVASLQAQGIASSHMRVWSVLVSAAVEYVLLLWSFWLVSLCFRRRRVLQEDLLRHVIALNHVLLPGAAYFILHNSLYCTSFAVPNEICDDRDKLMRDPSALAVGLAFVHLLVCFDAYLLWTRRHSLTFVSNLRRLGLICPQVYSRYAWWPGLESLCLLFFVAIASSLAAFEAPLLALLSIAFTQVLMLLLLKMVSPYLFKDVPRFKEDMYFLIALVAIMASFRTMESFTARELVFLDEIGKMLPALVEAYILAKLIWTLFINRVMLPLARREDTLAWLPLRRPVRLLRRWLGLHRTEVSKHAGDVHLLSKGSGGRFSRGQGRELAMGIGHILWASLSTSSALALAEVNAKLDAAVRSACRAHQAAISAGLSKGPRGADRMLFRIEGEHGGLLKGSPWEHLRSAAGRIMAHELTAAIQDANRDLGGRSYRQVKAKVKEPSKASEATSLPDSSSGVKQKEMPKLALQRREVVETQLPEVSSSAVEKEDHESLLQDLFRILDQDRALDRRLRVLAKEAQVALSGTSKSTRKSIPQFYHEEALSIFRLASDIEQVLTSTAEVGDPMRRTLREWIIAARLFLKDELELPPEMIPRQVSEILSRGTQGSEDEASDVVKEHDQEIPTPHSSGSEVSSASEVHEQERVLKVAIPKPRVARTAARLHRVHVQAA